jgi:hypothetical protein
MTISWAPTCWPQPGFWTKLTELEPRELRCSLVGEHEMRYEITAAGEIWILR